ncbi:MAG: hypothetical protein DI536_06270 [Archangium gephyra]|uniref:Uncharacterized protein n=1 Tax=Archangium gephyra TaxID=48 RepID=A0A2W5TZM3_9BACT|nr:MAG: hypothetical protein DI536_06270 [Archangium gephyra]
MSFAHAAVWSLLTDAPSDSVLEARLARLDDEVLAEVGAAVIDLRTELVDALIVGGLADDASEDVLDDLAGMLLREGERPYAAYLRSERPLPRREAWGGAAQQSMVPLVSRVVHERLGRSLLDLFDARV